MNQSYSTILCGLLAFLACGLCHANAITVSGEPVTLELRLAGAHGVRVTLNPVSRGGELPPNPALEDSPSTKPVFSIREIEDPVIENVGNLRLEVRPNPLTVMVRGADGVKIQTLIFRDDGRIAFPIGDQPVLGMGEGGPLPAAGRNWKEDSIEFDRRGRIHRMRPRWQSGAYGSRNPVPLLIGTEGWGIFFAAPWGEIDLSGPKQGFFQPRARQDPARMRQRQGNQGDQLGKGIPPMESIIQGFRDVVVFDARDPAAFMKDVSTISGPAVIPPKWALGYMQSHRTLEEDKQMTGIVDTFREKRIPIDAVIYLGTGFTPRGWNKKQPSFEFNPEVFKKEPVDVIADLHRKNVKVVLHMVPGDREELPTLHGTIPPAQGETQDASHIATNWNKHVDLVNTGVDGWWPDEGDWFDLYERMKRHQLYYQGPISTQPDRRPWSLHRNGYLGIAKWGGWVWSGDTHSTWKTLEGQIAVGINHSLSLSAYWGSDIGGFFSDESLTGELYARWFQFGAFCPSFRSHGRTWWTRLPWGWGLDSLGPLEDPRPPSTKELNNPEIERVARRYAELRYQLLSYNYTLAWEARDTGMPFMRALWLHYPEDGKARAIGHEYLWGRDLLVAPVYEPGAKSREVYLPEGTWYDWWNGKRVEGGHSVTRPVDLATMPIYVRAGALLPVDPIRQYTSEAVDGPLTIRIYQGADGASKLYSDDGESLEYLKGKSSLTSFTWDDMAGKLVIAPEAREEHTLPIAAKTIRIELHPGGQVKTVNYAGDRVEVAFELPQSR